MHPVRTQTPAHQRSRKSWQKFGRGIRVAFFVLFPLALLSGIALQIATERRSRHMETPLASDRGSAINAARDFLVTQGIDPTGWTAYCAAALDDNFYQYLKMQPPQDAAAALRLTPPEHIEVMLASPNDAQKAFVTLSLENRVVGYDLRDVNVAPDPAADPSSEASARMAAAVLAADPAVAAAFGGRRPEVGTVDRGQLGTARQFTWRAPLRPLREIEIQFSAIVGGGRVLGRSLTGNLDAGYINRHFDTQQSLLSIFYMLYSLLLTVIAIYSLVSYAKRAIQQEVSHSRTALVALFVTLLFSTVILSSRDDLFLQLARQNAIQLATFFLIIIALVVAGGGILIGIAYGSGEGDVRESFPGKLTSVDALVLGKVLSHNVGGAVIVGTAFASWLLLLRGLVGWLNTAAPGELASQAFKFPFMPAPWLTFFGLQPAIIIVFCVAGLLQPLAFLGRNVPNRRLRMALLVVSAVVILSGTAALNGSFFEYFVHTLTAVAGLLLTFFIYDFLAAGICLAALDFFGSISRTSVILPGWSSFFVWLYAVAGITLLVAAWAWWRGRAFSEEKLRPTYARHIAERVAMQAEVSAAREAQLRLLPQQIPSVPGISISAACLPARVVGGDFYDFFALDQGRLGIFIAEGGNRGLASALAIALAKGYLMHTARSGYSATQVLERLEATLGSILEGSSTDATLAYAIADPQQGRFSYARTGSYPKVVVASANSSFVEREVKPALDTKIPCIFEGVVDLAEGDSVLLYTDGVARRIGSRTTIVEEDWVRSLLRQQATEADQLHRGFLTALGVTAHHAARELEDDFTAVVIRFGRMDAKAMEGVA